MAGLPGPVRPLPAFPGKALRSLQGFRLQSRHEGLENYLSALLSAVSGGYGSDNVLDAVAGFLEVISLWYLWYLLRRCGESCLLLWFT